MAAPQVSETDDVWTRRWKAVESLIDSAIVDKAEDSRNASPAEGSTLIATEDESFNTIQRTLKKLKYFGRQQYYFFYQGIINQSNSVYKFEPSSVLNPESRFGRYAGSYSLAGALLNRIIGQVANDLAILRSAHDQRQVATGQTDSAPNAIQQADKLAAGAFAMIDKAVTANPQTKLITYLRPSTNVRLIPYAPNPLIGIPPTVVAEPRDLLAIPHEVGHYVYWYGTRTNLRNMKSQLDLQERLDSLFAEDEHHEIKIVRNWEEEIWADIVSCLVGGPVAALSFAELAKAKFADEFVLNDGNHPTPAIRPLLYAAILHALVRRQGAEKSQAAEKLEEEWRTYLSGERGITPAPALNANVTTVSEEEPETYLQAQLNRAIQMATVLLDYINIDTGTLVNGLTINELRWSDETDLPTDQWFDRFKDGRDTLIGKINQWLLATANLQTPDAPSQDDAANAVAEWRAIIKQTKVIDPDNSDWINHLSGDFSKDFSRSTEDDVPIQIPAEDWLAIFELGGWTTEGPDAADDQ